MATVYPVYKNKFKVGTVGRTSEAAEMKSIAEMESFSVAIDGNTVEWSSMDDEGWMKRMVTGKSLTVSLSGKRCVGDAGNDYVAGIAWQTGDGCDSKFEWVFPSGGKLAFDCVINVTSPGGGESRDLDALAFDVMSHGKPVYTAAT